MSNHEHQHNHSGLSALKFTGVVLSNAAITVAEVIGGLLSGSLALLSDAAHNFSDVMAVILSFVAGKVAGKAKNGRKTYGYRRAEILAAFLNAAILGILSVYLIIEALKRFQSHEVINTDIMLIVGSVGFVANLVATWILERDSHTSINVRSSYLHLLSDALSSAGVVLGALAIKFLGFYWIDPAITLGISIYILWESWKIVHKTVDILMQSSADLDYQALKKDIEALPEVNNIHHVHTWLADENTIYLEAHVEMEDQLLSKVSTVISRIETLLHDQYGIEHATIQVETARCKQKALFKP